MKGLSLSTRGRQVAALAILAGLATPAILLIVLPAMTLLHGLSEHQDDAAHELARRQALAANAPALKALVEQIDAHPLWSRLYTATTDAAASSQLQSDFRALADAEQVRVDTLQPLPSQVEAEFTRIGLRVGFTTTLDRLSKLTLAMKAAPKLVRFENLYVAAPLSQDPANNPLLTVRADVAADALRVDAP